MEKRKYFQNTNTKSDMLNNHKTSACQQGHTTRTPNSANYDQLSKSIAKAIKYVEENLAKENKCTLEQVAKYVGSSRSVFCRLFKQEVGMTFQNYKDKVRIDIAKRLLENGNLEIETIILHCGYDTSSGLRRMFKAVVKMTPTEYHRKYRTK